MLDEGVIYYIIIPIIIFFMGVIEKVLWQIFSNVFSFAIKKEISIPFFNIIIKNVISVCFSCFLLWLFHYFLVNFKDFFKLRITVFIELHTNVIYILIIFLNLLYYIKINYKSRLELLKLKKTKIGIMLLLDIIIVYMDDYSHYCDFKREPFIGLIFSIVGLIYLTSDRIIIYEGSYMSLFLKNGTNINNIKIDQIHSNIGIITINDRSNGYNKTVKLKKELIDKVEIFGERYMVIERLKDRLL